MQSYRYQFAGMTRRNALLVMLVTFAACALTFAVNRAYAQEDVSPAAVRDQIQRNKEERINLREDQREERQGMRADIIASTTTSFEDRRQMQMERFATFQEQAQDRMEQRRTSWDVTRTALQDRRADLEARLSEKKKNVKARLAEQAQARIGIFVANIEDMMSRALGRMDQIVDRLMARIVEQEREGFDMTAARDALTTAKEFISAARDDVVTYRAIADATFASDDPKAGMPDVREAAQVARESILAARNALKAALAEIREALNTEKGMTDEDGSNEEDSTTTE